MKAVLDWIKSNILADIAIVIVLASVGAMVFFYLQGGTLRKDMQAREKTVTKINAFNKKVIRIPDEDPNKPEVQKTGQTINNATIEAVKGIRARMSNQAKGTSRHLLKRNRENHSLLMDNMLPTTTRAYDAREAYLAAMAKLLQPYDADSPVAGIHAGLPPSSEVIQEELAKVRERFTQVAGQGAAAPVRDEDGPRTRPRNRFEDPEAGFREPRRVGGGVDRLSDDDQLRLQKHLKDQLSSMLQDRAKSILIYADPDMKADGTKNPDFPLMIGEWAMLPSGQIPGEKPDNQRLFEGQLEFWIQQDIIRAILLANTSIGENPSVLTAPVKRLLRLEVLPGYVGLHGSAAPSGNNWGGAQPGNFGGGDFEGGMGSTATPVTPVGVKPLYPIPPANSLGDPDKPLPVDFSLSPTGRVSNVIYDVRHARLRVVVDATQIPALLSRLSEVNLMTVIDMKVTDVDEWVALREGFVYECDAVELELLIETLWLRDWTTPLMPRETRLYLGIDTPAAAVAQQ